MMGYRFFISCICIALVFAKLPSASASEDGALRAPFKAIVTVNVDGAMEIGEMRGISGALLEVVKQRLAARKAIPAKVDGVAVPSTMELTGVAVMTPIDAQDMNVTLEGLQLVPRLLKVIPPLYPVAMYRRNKEAVVEAVIEIDTDGHATIASFLRPVEQEFSKAIHKSVKTMRFPPPPTSITITLPFWFHVASSKSAVLPDYQCGEIDTGQAHIARQSGCLDLFEITASRVMRSATNL